jgi:hypothetical protein
MIRFAHFNLTLRSQPVAVALWLVRSYTLLASSPGPLSISQLPLFACNIKSWEIERGPGDEATHYTTPSSVPHTWTDHTSYTNTNSSSQYFRKTGHLGNGVITRVAVYMHLASHNGHTWIMGWIHDGGSKVRGFTQYLCTAVGHPLASLDIDRGLGHFLFCNF